MKTAIMKLKDIRPAAYNPESDAQAGRHGVRGTEKLIGAFRRGRAFNLIVNETTGNLVSGHQRLNVLKASGAQEVEVVLVEMDGEQEKLLNIAMNKIDGEWDYKKLEALFDEIEADDIKFTGFTPEELDNLFDAGTPDWGDGEGEDGADGEADAGDEKPETPEKPQVLKEFNIFLSFPSKKNWRRNGLQTGA